MALLESMQQETIGKVENLQVGTLAQDHVAVEWLHKEPDPATNEPKPVKRRDVLDQFSPENILEAAPLQGKINQVQHLCGPRTENVASEASHVPSLTP